MGLFSTSAAERAAKTRAAAERTKRSLEAAIIELRQMEHLLQRIESEVPKQAPGSAFRKMQGIMERTESHADYTLVHMRKIKEHLKVIEGHLKKQ